jgi:aspartate racemase
MKKIGLVGGMTPESTTEYYRTIIELGRERWDNPLRNPVVLIYSLDLSEIAAHQNVGEEGRVVEILVDVLESLRRAGAEVGALTANTPHVFFDRIAGGTSLPLVNIVDATHKRVRSLGVSRVLLLGTNATMEASMYPDVFSSGGIETVIPNEDDRRFVNRSIYEELAVGKITPALRTTYLEICGRHVREDSVDAIVLGCTEIPLVLKDGDVPVPLIDTARCHAEAIFDLAAV